MTRRKLLALTSIFIVLCLLTVAFTFEWLEQKQVQGIVRDAASGRPISAASVQIGATTITSDEQGEFWVSLAHDKGRDLAAVAPGYLPTTFSFNIPWYSRSGQIDVELAPQGVSFLVVDRLTGRPQPDTTIQVGSQLSLQTDADGKAQSNLTQFEPPLRISVKEAGYLPWQMELTRLPQDSSELPLVIDLDPQILEGLVIEGDTETPLSGVKVVVGEFTLETDAKGRFFLYRLKPGETVAVIPDKGLLPAEFIFEDQEEITVTLTPRQLQVQVVDRLSGSPITGAQARILAQTKTSNEAGQVTLTHVPPQDQLQINHPDYVTHTIAYHIDQPPTVALTPNKMVGVIRDASTGEALTAASVVLGGESIILETDAIFRLNNLQAARNMSFKLAGYKPAKLAIQATGETILFDATNLDIEPCVVPLEDDQAEAPCYTLALQPFDAKAIYVPFSHLSDPDIIYNTFDLIARTELNAIIIDVKNDDGFLAWDSDTYQADYLEIDGDRAGWMTLETFLAEAQARDIYTIARMVTFKDKPLAFGYPDLAITYADGTIWIDDEGLAWASPFKKTVWDYNISLAKEIAALGFDEINLDYIRFPSDGNINAITYLEENTIETRTQALRGFMQSMSEALTPYGTYLSADVFGLTVWVEPENDMNIGQRVIDIAPYVDYLAPMIYPSTFIPGNLGLSDPSSSPYEVIFQSQNAAVERVPAGTKVRPWLQAYWYSLNEMLLQKQAANDANSAGWLWWNAGGIYDENLFEVQ